MAKRGHNHPSRENVMAPMYMTCHLEGPINFRDFPCLASASILNSRREMFALFHKAEPAERLKTVKPVGCCGSPGRTFSVMVFVTRVLSAY